MASGPSDATVAGVCTDLGAESTTSLALLPTTVTTTTFEAEGPCVTTNTAPLSSVTGSFSATVTSLLLTGAMACAGGVGVGSGSFTSAAASVSASFTVVLIVIGAVAVVAMAATPDADFVGSGVFVYKPSPLPVPAWPTACANLTGHLGTMSWLGGLAFANV